MKTLFICNDGKIRNLREKIKMDKVVDLAQVRRHKDDLEPSDIIDPFEKIIATNEEKKRRQAQERLEKQRDVLRSYNIRPKDPK